MSTHHSAKIIQWWKAHRAAQKAFLKIPGVVSVGLGIKEVAKKLNGQVALIAYVEKKVAANQLAEEVLIPKTFMGVSTDVRQLPPHFSFLGNNQVLLGGNSIQRHTNSKGEPLPGTLGYIATHAATDVILSCEHVLKYNTEDKRKIYHPDVSRCGVFFYNKVGEAIAGIRTHHSFDAGHGEGAKDYFVDAAIASIDPGVTASKCIIDIPTINGSGDVTDSPTRGEDVITVRKTGIKTGNTKGEIEDVYFTTPLPMGTWVGRTPTGVFTVRPVTGFGFDYSVILQIRDAEIEGYYLSKEETIATFEAGAFNGTLTDLGDDKYEFSCELFVDTGDSGALIIDDTDAAVGMVFAGAIQTVPYYDEKGKEKFFQMPLGYAYCVHIRPLMDALGITIDASTGTCSSADLVVPESRMADGEPLDFPSVNQGLANLRGELQHSLFGKEMLYIIDTGISELVKLVHHNRKAVVAWNRANGPAYLASLLKCTTDYQRPLPKKVKDTPVETILQAMYKVLTETGSPFLRKALEQHKESLFYLLLECDNLQNLLKEIKIMTPTKTHSNA